MEIQSNLFQLREARHLSAARLAALAGISRQTVYALEAGVYVPNTALALRLAAALSVSVEDIFQLPSHRQEGHSCSAEVLSGESELRPGQPMRLCRVGDRLVGVSSSDLGAWSLPVADGVVLDCSAVPAGAAKARVQVLEEPAVFDSRLLIAGCDPAVTVLARHLQREKVTLVMEHQNSSKSLELLKRGVIHVAGTHIRDQASGESNLAAIERLFRRTSIAVVSLAYWEAGIVVAPGNPKGIRSPEDLSRKDVRLVNREPGAGARMLLDTHLRRLGISPQMVNGYNYVASGHLPAARLVQSGQADCCIATSAAARVFGLDFIPLVTERYDLVTRKGHLQLPQVQALFETLGRAAFRHELEDLAGYDAKPAGNRIV
jgi:molybdate-binding protein/DNA-binding XRE family transcriptional regulator